MPQPLTSDNYNFPSLLVMRILQHDSSDDSAVSVWSICKNHVIITFQASAEQHFVNTPYTKAAGK